MRGIRWIVVLCMLGVIQASLYGTFTCTEEDEKESMSMRSCGRYKRGNSCWRMLHPSTHRNRYYEEAVEGKRMPLEYVLWERGWVRDYRGLKHRPLDGIGLIWQEITQLSYRDDPDCVVGLDKKVGREKWLNYIPGFMQYVNPKDELWYTLNGTGLTPLTFVLPADKDAFEQYKADYGGRFIYKPVYGGRGRGISFDRNLSMSTSKGDIVAQLLIDQPMLLQGYKFTIRVYVLVTSIDPLVSYLWDNGIVKRSADPIQGDSYRVEEWVVMASVPASEEEDTIPVRFPLKSLALYLGSEKSELVMEGMKDSMRGLLKAYLARMTFPIVVEKRFQILGVDVDVDEAGRVYILDVNVNPSLGGSPLMPFDNVDKIQMLLDVFNTIWSSATSTRFLLL